MSGSVSVASAKSGSGKVSGSVTVSSGESVGGTSGSVSLLTSKASAARTAVLAGRSSCVSVRETLPSEATCRSAAARA
ncbi:hypothetical protein PF003_g10570 [Phytophthora fragariae]|nr:hypothetical protein PF003_g10570 [Phytophthora fragariae]